MDDDGANHRTVLPDTDGANPWTVLAAVRACSVCWQPDVRIIGNVRAGDIARAIQAVAVESGRLEFETPTAGLEEDIEQLRRERDGWRALAEGRVEVSAKFVSGLLSEIDQLKWHVVATKAEAETASAPAEQRAMAAKGARLLSWLWERWSEGRDVDGDDIQGFLTKEGFVRRVPYDPARHGTDFEAAEFMEPGDDYFEPSEIGRTMLDAARIRKVPTSRDDDNG